MKTSRCNQRFFSVRYFALWYTIVCMSRRKKNKNIFHYLQMQPTIGELLFFCFLVALTSAFTLFELLEHIHFFTSIDLYRLSIAVDVMITIGVSSISFARFFAKKNDTVLFIGFAFVSHGIIDALRLLAISDYGIHHFRVSQYALVHWSWLASETVWVSLLAMSAVVWFLQKKYGEQAHVRWGVLSLVVALLTLSATIFFFTTPVTIDFYQPLGPFLRPWELIPGLISLIALVLFFIKGDWEHDAFDFGLLIALLCTSLGHFFFGSQSTAIFDQHFYAAQLLTQTGMLIVAVGLFYSMTTLFQDVESKELQLVSRVHDLKREKAMDDTFIESIGDAIIVTDSDTRITRVNKAFEETMGWTKKEAIGQPVTKVLPMFDLHNAAIPYEKRPQAKALFAGERIETSMEYTYQRKDGSLFSVASTVTPVIVDGDIIGAIEVFRDVSKEKMIDEQKSTFVSVASHQLRTPLTTLNWYTEMLLSGDAGKINKKQKEFLLEIYQGSKRLVVLVNDLLNISRIESGRLKIQPVETSIHSLIKETVAEIRPLLRGRSTSVTVDIPALQFTDVLIDPLILRQVIHNLLTNAIRYSSKDTKSVITISVQKKRFALTRNKAAELRPGSYIVIAVKDQGIGIPKNQQDRIFEKFFRADNALHAAADGSGLGLYFIKMIMQESGGALWFTSKENQGSTFFVAIPVTGMKAKVGDKEISTVASTELLSKEKK